MKKILILLLIAALLAIAAGCSQPAPAPEQPPATPAPTKVTPRTTTVPSLPPTTIPAPARTPSVSDNTIAITKTSYAPQQLTVKVGADVRWVNNDERIHRILFLDDVKTPLLSPGQSYTRSFTKPGTYDYSDAMVTGLQGTIIVE